MANTRSTSGASGANAPIINKKRKANSGLPAVADNPSTNTNEDTSDTSEDTVNDPIDPDKVDYEVLFSESYLFDHKKQSPWTVFDGPAEISYDALSHAPLQHCSRSHPT
ncbi:hypothetical protein OXX59_001478 [Metschnikowia pulcherrima]